ncbi:hypothetical protein BD289DRAFT_192946 [Coniella lustricola]|uniref:Uncharacterized protein n=1 Tax=Coniella lustricola TaxID=2025994 RepID=A0A2T3ALW8_9PEZI|nr:hypothetical protein BD289DRAFT_192946 [Coniella lustricola]
MHDLKVLFLALPVSLPCLALLAERSLCARFVSISQTCILPYLGSLLTAVLYGYAPTRLKWVSCSLACLAFLFIF